MTEVRKRQPRYHKKDYPDPHQNEIPLLLRRCVGWEVGDANRSVQTAK